MSYAVEIEDVEKMVAEAEKALVAKLESLGLQAGTAWRLVNIEYDEWLRRTGHPHDYHDWKTHHAACRAWATFVHDIYADLLAVD